MSRAVQDPAAGDRTEAVRAWLVGRLAPGRPPSADLLSGNIFEMRLVDSLGIIELIEAVESRFAVRFTEEHFLDRRFATIDGLTEIILELEDA